MSDIKFNESVFYSSKWEINSYSSNTAGNVILQILLKFLLKPYIFCFSSRIQKSSRMDQVVTDEVFDPCLQHPKEEEWRTVSPHKRFKWQLDTSLRPVLAMGINEKSFKSFKVDMTSYRNSTLPSYHKVFGYYLLN